MTIVMFILILGWVIYVSCQLSDIREVLDTKSRTMEPRCRNTHGLSPDQLTVLDLMKDGPVKRRTVESALGFSEDKVRGILDALMEAGLVHRSGRGKATYYTKDQ